MKVKMKEVLFVSTLLLSAGAHATLHESGGMDTSKVPMNDSMATPAPKNISEQSTKEMNSMATRKSVLREQSSLYTRSQVRSIQQKLQDKGFYTAEVDGLVGPQTASAIKEFQREESLTVTGSIDRQLVDSLGIQFNANDRYSE